MNQKLTKKINIGFILILLIFFIISVLTIFSSLQILDLVYKNLYIKQIIWYFLGFLLMFFIFKIGNSKILKWAKIIYIVNIILLILVLFFAPSINNAKSWFIIPYVGNFQPSEFMKISLILIIAKLLNNYHFSKDKTLKKEFILILKAGLLTLIPSVLAFLEPDTGVVIFYIFILVTMLFIAGIRLRWFIVFSFLLSGAVISFFIIYFKYQNLFIDFFGNTFFYRIQRLLDWSNSSGMQLENSLISIGSAGVFGKGFTNTLIYFPEPYTDFIFSVFASNFGFLGGVALILIIFFFDLLLIKVAISNSSTISKYIVSGILACLIYAQIQNISMVLGLLPITGIPLPFISYGGSSLITYLIMLSIALNFVNKKN